MALDAVKPLCLETPATGTQLDAYPTEVDPRQDALTAAGYFLNGPSVTANDKAVLVDRTGNSLRLTDGVTSHVLGELVSATTGQVGSHDGLRDLAHFLGGQGPGTGFASGAYCARSFVGLLLQSETWFTSSTQATKIVGRSLAYLANSALVSSETWTIYGPTGSALRTLVDTHTYSGIVRIATTRTWS